MRTLLTLLAFLHLDADRNGYITFDNLVSMFGGTNASRHGLSDMRALWEVALAECNCKVPRITYNDFKQFMMQQSVYRSSKPVINTRTARTEVMNLNESAVSVIAL